ncbi:MAG: 4-hydroxy-tetrahydrodipicolinate synthase [Actinomycetota bacterium]|jgi:4-hydroxy-tetrahydrodipicolinate synthase|nr:MAG: 4-hydroxy-tetrahydrodipicolinate synthase [Actinomycetota bacterium]
MAGRFGSVITAMVTPFRDDHAVDLDRAQELASWLVDNGSDAVVVAGSTGESPTLSHHEKAELFAAVVEAIRGRGRVICGTGTYSTAETLELTRAAEAAGADGLLVVTPYYNKPPQRGLVAHFEAVAEASSLPIILYNIPGRTGTRIEHDTLLRLAERPTIVAVKDSTGDFQAISRLIAESPEGFEVYSGDDWATFGYVCLGAVGVVSVAAHLVGPQIRQMIELIETGDVPAARKIHEDLSPLFNALFVTSNPIPVKAALEMVGRPCGAPRLPLVPATPEERERIRRALEDAGLLG